MNRLAVLLLLAACADSAAPPTEGGDLPLGDVEGDTKADGNGWGSALDCKAIPDLPPLVAPHITVSIYGLTLHLQDPVTGYDKVFPIGPGKVDQDENDPELGESLTYRPIIDHGTGDFAITPGSSVACKTWWTDAETGARSPVFAGLPFMSWSGNYGIHGPIDNFRAPNGGTCATNPVSHTGYCTAHCSQYCPDRTGYPATFCTSEGTCAPRALDQDFGCRPYDHMTPQLTTRPNTSVTATVCMPHSPGWIGDHCTADADCNAGLACKGATALSSGVCTQPCTALCPDQPGWTETTCVDAPMIDAGGSCLRRCTPSSNASECPRDMDCAPEPRALAPSTTRYVCVPRSASNQ